MNKRINMRNVNLLLFFILLSLVSFVFAVPSVSNVVLNSSTGLAYNTSDNLTIHYTLDEGDINRTMIDWRVNGSSIAVLNLNFEPYTDLGRANRPLINATDTVYVANSSTVYGAGFEAFKAFGYNLTSGRWASSNTNGGVPEWIELDIGSDNQSYIVKGFALQPYTAESFGLWQLNASNDRDTWITLAQGTNPSEDYDVYYNFSNSNYYRYYRFHMMAPYQPEILSLSGFTLLVENGTYMQRLPHSISTNDFMISTRYFPTILTPNDGMWSPNGGPEGRGAYAFSGGRFMLLSYYHPEKTNTSVLDFTTQNFTILTRIYPNSNNAGQVWESRYEIASTDSGWMFGLGSTGTLVFDLGGPDDNDNAVRSSATNVYVAGAWQWLGVVKAGNNVSYYANGVPRGSSLFTSGTIVYETAITYHYIGQVGGGFADGSYGIPARNLDATMANLLIFNRSLSPEEILMINNTNSFDVLSSQETNDNENWSVFVKPANSTQSGASVVAPFSQTGTAPNNLPIVSDVFINATFGTNFTNENLTVYWTSTDGDGDAVVNITDWRVNGTSIAILNMPFEADGNQNATDYSTYGNNGTVVNATWNATGGHDGHGAYELIDDNKYIYHADNAAYDFTTEFSIAARVKSSDSGYGYIVTKWGNAADTDSYHLRIDATTGFLYFTTSLGGSYESARDTIGTSDVSDGNWHLVTATYDNVSSRVYVDGVLETTKATTGSIFNSSSIVAIGAIADGPNSNSLVGFIDDVQIYNRALSTEQILALNASRTDLIVSQELNAGENWSACITPNDGTQDGATVCSSNITILSAVSATAILNLTYPLNGSEIARGKDTVALPSEDALMLVDNNLVIRARVYDVYDTSAGLSANCSFYFNETILGVNHTNSSGDCSFSFDMSNYEPHLYNLSVNFTDLDSPAVPNTENISANITIAIDKFSVNLDPLYDTNNKYQVGEAAVLNISVFKNDVPYDATYILGTVLNTGGGTLATKYYPGDDLTKMDTGVYLLVYIVQDNSDIHWNVYINNTGNVLVSTASHADVAIDAETANFTINAINANNNSLNMTVVLKDRNGYELEANVSNSSVTFIHPVRKDGLFAVNATSSSGEEIIFNNINLTDTLSNLSLDIVKYSLDLPASVKNITNLVAIGNLTYNITNATIRIPNGGVDVTAIYKCNNWNSSSKTCGSWSYYTSDFTEDANYISFTVTGFSGYAGGAPFTSNLTIWDQNDTDMSYSGLSATTLNQINFYANYTNSTDGTSIGGLCNITFNVTPEGPFNMIYNESNAIHYFNRTFDTAGIYMWNVTCSNSSFDTLTANDTIVISLVVPVITAIFPNATNETESIDASTINTTVYSLNSPNITYNVTVSDADSDVLTFNWFVDGVLQLVSTVTNLVSDLFSSIFSFTFTELGMHNVTLVVNDSAVNDTFTFLVNSSDTIAPVISLVTNISISNSSATINWTTDEAANSTVNYGIALTLGSALSNTSYVTQHSINVTGLLNATLYYYNITSCDVSGNCNVSDTFNFTTLASANDTSAPVISSVANTSISNESSTVSWDTDDSSNGTVSYGTTLSLGTNITNSSFLTSRAINLTGLLNATLYYYNITSCNEFGNCTTNGTFNFTTLASANDTSAPVISSVTNTSISNNSATINWATDDNANGTVMYGITLSLGTNITNSSFLTSRAINLTGLLNATLYYYNITSCNIYGNCTTNGTFNFTTAEVPDSTPPAVYSVTNISLSNSSATINWTTDELANSTVTYGTTTSLGSQITNSSFVTAHSINVTGLLNSTLYYYNITSCDNSSNCQTNGTFNFTTLASANDTSAPVISSVANTSISNESSTVSWDTDDSSNGTVSYGTTLSLGTNITNSSFITSRAINLTSLLNATLYYYNITSCNEFGNCTTNGTYNFTTALGPVVSVAASTTGGGGHACTNSLILNVPSSIKPEGDVLSTLEVTVSNAGTCNAYGVEVYAALDNANSPVSSITSLKSGQTKKIELTLDYALRSNQNAIFMAVVASTSGYFKREEFVVSFVRDEVTNEIKEAIIEPITEKPAPPVTEQIGKEPNVISSFLSLNAKPISFILAGIALVLISFAIINRTRPPLVGSSGNPPGLNSQPNPTKTNDSKAQASNQINRDKTKQ